MSFTLKNTVPLKLISFDYDYDFSMAWLQNSPLINLNFKHIWIFKHPQTFFLLAVMCPCLIGVYSDYHTNPLSYK